MTTLSRFINRTAITSLPAETFNWFLRLATRMAARSLNMPEPLLQDAGAFVFAHVQAAEHRAARTLCPLTLLRRALARRGWIS